MGEVVAIKITEVVAVQSQKAQALPTLGRLKGVTLLSRYQPGLKGVSTHGISGYVDETPLVLAPKLNRD
jgi:hypothetical protein